LANPASSIVPVKTSDLKIGMYVLLPASWFKHPFLKNRFLLASQKEIEKIKNSGFGSVQVDFSKSKIRYDEAVQSERNRAGPRKKWNPERIVPPELVEAVRNKDMPIESKAAVVKESSLLLMNRLFDNPSAENIREAKQGIFEMVDCIISEDEMSRCLLSITSHDLYTYTHSVNVGFLALILAKELFKNSYDHNMHELGAGFFLHDLGKVGIDSAIINKPGKLTDEETRIIRSHPAEGARMLANMQQLSNEAEIIIGQHHERQDGSGYPQGLKGKQIHIYARICSIADVYDALTSERSYKRKLRPFEALELMRDEMIHHFQRDLFEKFVKLFLK
jgi:HD-GYP domain-containing protein (c-di-GMP phosphodiesterase class II)